MTWNDEKVELLKMLWAEGLSASQIATRLGGMTRNAVIGKVHRLGLSGRVKSQAPSSAPAAAARETASAPRAPRATAPMAAQPASHGNLALKFQAAPKPKPAAAPALSLVAEEAQDDKGCRATILSLNEQTCRWPVGDPSADDFYFCGRTSGLGTPYCEHHARIAYQPTQDRRRNRPRAAGAEARRIA